MYGIRMVGEKHREPTSKYLFLLLFCKKINTNIIDYNHLTHTKIVSLVFRGITSLINRKPIHPLPYNLQHMNVFRQNNHRAETKYNSSFYLPFTNLFFCASLQFLFSMIIIIIVNNFRCEAHSLRLVL